MPVSRTLGTRKALSCTYSPYFSPASHARTGRGTGTSATHASCVVEEDASPAFIPQMDAWIEMVESHSKNESGLPQEYRMLLDVAGFKIFSAIFLRSYQQLFHAKPTLIQDHVAENPWKLLCAVMLLNKTAGKNAVPTFLSLMEMWPTPYLLSRAPQGVVYSLIRHLGLGEQRADRLIKLSQMYLDDPPRHDTLRRSRCTVTHNRIKTNVDGEERACTPEIQYPPTPVSHLPGCGPYALDSYRIFCYGGDEWKSVRPMDKELRLFLKWKWAVEELRQWDPAHGPGDLLDLQDMQLLTAQLRERWGE